jgi:hypothetical protein
VYDPEGWETVFGDIQHKLIAIWHENGVGSGVAASQVE